MRVWGIEEKQPVLRNEIGLGKDTPVVRDLAASPAQQVFVCASSNRTGSQRALSLWDLQSSKNTQRFVSGNGLQAGSCPLVNSCTFSHNGNMLLCGGENGMLRVFDVGGMSSAPIMTWRAHQGTITQVAFSSDFSCVYSAGEDGCVVQWSLYKIGTILKSFRMTATEAQQ